MTDNAKTQKPEEAKKSASRVKISDKLKKIIDEVEKLSVLELNDLVKALEDKFGVSASPAVALAQAGAAPTTTAGAAAPQAEEKSEYQVVLAAAGANKIGVIKALREINSQLGLKEAKDLTEAAPKEVGSFKKEAAEAAKKKLEAAGAQVELK